MWKQQNGQEGVEHGQTESSLIALIITASLRSGRTTQLFPIT